MKANQFAKNEEAQVGIGTMIVFISTILVAAVAAGVLVSVGSDLQSQSHATSSEARQEVSNQLKVVGVWARDITNGAAPTPGVTDDPEAVDTGADDDNADELLIATTLASGSTSFDMTTMEIIIDDGTSVNTYTYFDHGIRDSTEGANVADGNVPATAGYYFALEAQGVPDRSSDTELNDGEVMMVRILGYYDDTVGTTSFGERLNIAPGSSVKVTMLPPSGASKFMDLQMPNVMDNDVETIPF